VAWGRLVRCGDGGTRWWWTARHCRAPLSLRVPFREYYYHYRLRPLPLDSSGSGDAAVGIADHVRG
jgi:hypothetical protein